MDELILHVSSPGKNLLDGRYACFGYTVNGARLLSDVKEGDVIESAKASFIIIII